MRDDAAQQRKRTLVKLTAKVIFMDLQSLDKLLDLYFGELRVQTSEGFESVFRALRKAVSGVSTQIGLSTLHVTHEIHSFLRCSDAMKAVKGDKGEMFRSFRSGISDLDMLIQTVLV